MLRSPLFSTTTMKRGSVQRFQYLETVISALMPSICMAPSPTSAIAGRCGKANLAAAANEIAGPMVARVPDTAIFMPCLTLRARAK